MKHSTPTARFVAVLIALFSSAPSQAVLYTAPKIEPAQAQAYLDQLIQAHPGLSQVADQVRQYTNIVQAEQTLLPHLNEFPEFAKLANQKPELQTISVTLKEEETRVYTLHKTKFEERKASLIEFLRSNILLASGGNAEGTLFIRLSKRFKQIIDSTPSPDPKGLITGIIQSLPPEKRNAIFKLSNPKSQLSALQNESNLTDLALSKNFRAENFGMHPTEANRELLLQMVADRILLEEELTQIARFMTYTAVTTNERANQKPRSWEKTFMALISRIENETDPNAFSFSQKDIEHQLIYDWIDTPGSIDAFHRIINTRSKTDFDSVKVDSKRDTLRIVEQPPNVSIYRSAITGDCSTTNSWAFPYSPLEREYFIFLPNGKFVGHVGATLVTLNKKKTLYLHDVKGSQLSPKIGSLVLHAFHLSVKNLGVDQISLATVEQTESTNNSPQMKEILSVHRGELFAQTYADTKIRLELLGVQPGSSPYYDKPDQQGHLFVPSKEALNQIVGVEVSSQRNNDRTTLQDWKVDPKELLGRWVTKLEEIEALFKTKDARRVDDSELLTLSLILGSKEATDEQILRSLKILAQYQLRDEGAEKSTLANIASAAKKLKNIRLRLFASAVAAAEGVADQKIFDALQAPKLAELKIPKNLRTRCEKALIYLQKVNPKGFEKLKKVNL